MRNYAFQRWMAPFVGAAAGALVASRGHIIDPDLSVGPLAATGAAIGFIAGALISLAEPTSVHDDSDEARLNRGTLFGRLFALLSLILVWAPVIGFALAGIALLLNRRVHGWPRKVSYITLVISALLSVASIVMVVTSSPDP